MKAIERHIPDRSRPAQGVFSPPTNREDLARRPFHYHRPCGSSGDGKSIAVFFSLTDTKGFLLPHHGENPACRFFYGCVGEWKKNDALFADTVEGQKALTDYPPTVSGDKKRLRIIRRQSRE
jgi:hypothetical protein